MKKSSETIPFVLSGRWRYRLRSIFTLYWSTLYVSIRRFRMGPRLPGWSWSFETSVHFIKSQSKIGFEMDNIAEGREYEDSLVIKSTALREVAIEPVNQPVKGIWVSPVSPANHATALYLHGGGYAYYSKSHLNLISLVTSAIKSRTFALDYPLIPEHPFPAQLEYALKAYQWLLNNGANPKNLIIIGDSAGGNLALALLITLRDSNMPLPALVICLSPWTDVSNPGASMTRNAPYDWIEKQMAVQWAEWLCQGKDTYHPLISPINADLKDLPPIYIQAGDAEILYDMICQFASKAEEQGGRVILEGWHNMPHDFQAFGNILPQSSAALLRLGEVVREYIKDGSMNVNLKFYGSASNTLANDKSCSTFQQ